MNKKILIALAALSAAAGIAVALTAPSHADEPAYADDDTAGVSALAKMLYGECRGVKSRTEQAACVWVVLNRVDDERWPDDVVDVLSQPYQFGGYREYFPVEDWAYELAADVVDRWKAGHETGQNPGRVIPEDYFYWRGSRDGHNWFRKEFADYRGETYIFDLESPYEN